jgi:hypothetical protein
MGSQSGMQNEMNSTFETADRCYARMNRTVVRSSVLYTTSSSETMGVLYNKPHVIDLLGIVVLYGFLQVLSSS